jgi:hypothetical protein
MFALSGLNQAVASARWTRAVVAEAIHEDSTSHRSFATAAYWRNGWVVRW